MGQVLLVTLREGIEMFLIVAIAAAYLRKTGRAALLPAVAWGTGAAVIVSVVLGVWLAEVAVLPKWEALLALVDAVAFNPTSTLLATGCHDGKMRIYDIAKGQPVREIAAHGTPQMPAPLYCVAWDLK